MGRDGAEGLLKLRRKCWTTIAQDEMTSVVYGMPRAAVELDAADQVLPVSMIAAAILRHLHAVVTTGRAWDPRIATGQIARGVTLAA